MDMKALSKSMDKAKIKLLMLKNSTFITTVLFSLVLEWTDKVPTAGVDGKTMYVNPDFWLKLSLELQMSLLAHETWHVAFNHMFRGKTFNKSKYNRAADYVINIMLRDDNYAIGDTWLCEPQYRHMSTNEVYALLPDEPEDEQGGAGGMLSDIMDPDEETADEVKQQVEDILIKAAMSSKLQGDASGTIPGDIQVVLEDLLNPKLDWRTILQNYFSSYSKNDFTFKRPNRRFMPDYYLPSLHSENLGEVGIAVDTSGSVSNKEFAIFLTEINDIKEKLNPLLTTIIDFDTSIKHVHKLSPDESVQGLPFAGRGGTELDCVFDYYTKDKPTVLIVFSDLWCDQIHDDPGYPVVWICTDHTEATVNFGKLIHYNTKEKR